MINLEKIKQEKCQSPPTPILRRPASAPFYHPTFFNFSDLPSLIRTCFLTYKKGGGVRGLCYVSLYTSCLISVIKKKKPSQQPALALNLNFIHPCLALIYIYIYIYNIIYIYIQSFVSPCSMQTDLDNLDIIQGSLSAHI